MLPVAAQLVKVGREDVEVDPVLDPFSISMEGCLPVKLCLG